jgi:hypothetical protein
LYFARVVGHETDRGDAEVEEDIADLTERGEEN